MQIINRDASHMKLTTVNPVLGISKNHRYSIIEIVAHHTYYIPTLFFWGGGALNLSGRPKATSLHTLPKLESAATERK